MLKWVYIYIKDDDNHVIATPLAAPGIDAADLPPPKRLTRKQFEKQTKSKRLVFEYRAMPPTDMTESS